METRSSELYFDPFAEEGEQLFDPAHAFTQLEERYRAGNVRHDYTADNFVRDTEALMLDAVFVERFDAVQAMASRMHQLCGEDHMLGQAFQSNETFSDFMSGHGKDDGHNHNDNSHSKHKDDDEYEVDPKTGKKTKKKKRYSWFSLLLK